MTTTFLVEVDFLDFFEEPHFFKALFAGNVAQAHMLRCPAQTHTTVYVKFEIGCN
jgi:hypothetical protein